MWGHRCFASREPGCRPLLDRKPAERRTGSMHFCCVSCVLDRSQSRPHCEQPCTSFQVEARNASRRRHPLQHQRQDLAKTCSKNRIRSLTFRQTQPLRRLVARSCRVDYPHTETGGNMGGEGVGVEESKRDAAALPSFLPNACNE